jgi:hypothetical protein
MPDISTSRTTPALLPLAVAAFAVAASTAFAQSVPITPPGAKRWDAAVSVGWLGGNKSDIGEDWNDWYDTFAASVDAGRYWGPHLKTEAGFTFTTDGTVFSHEVIPLPGQPYPVFIPREHRFRLRAATVSAAWQFFENQWVHPFLLAGAQFGSERERSVSRNDGFYGIDPRAPVAAPPAPPVDRTRFSVRPFAGGGAKFYVNERGFLRTDVTLAWDGGGIAQAAWRAGIGIDF